MDATIQHILNRYAENMQAVRATEQMTLGELISVLENIPASTSVPTLINPHSYRGFYEDLAFEYKESKVMAGRLLEVCTKVLGKKFEGYKGGTYTMGECTPVWVADFGCLGFQLINFTESRVECKAV